MEKFLGGKSGDSAEIVNPIHDCTIDRWDAMEELWEHCLDQLRSKKPSVIKDADVTQQPVMINWKPASSKANKEIACQIWFEKFEVVAWYPYDNATAIHRHFTHDQYGR